MHLNVSHFLLAFLLFIHSPHVIFAMDQPEDKKTRILFDPLRVPQFTETISRQLPQFDASSVSKETVESSDLNKQALFLDVLISELEAVLQSAPEIVHTIIKHLKDPSFLHAPEFRYSIFVGPPGSGKTTTAKAIAYQMHRIGWDAHILCAGDIIGDKRNQTAVRLREILTSVTAVSKPVIIIIDELNELLENAHDEHYDTSATAKFLWQFLDQQENNPRFFLIGTMNNDTKLPQPFKSRIFLRRVEFQALNRERALQHLKLHLSKASITLAPEVGQEKLHEFLESIAHCSGRDLRELILRMKLMLKSNAASSSDQLIVTADMLDLLAQEYTKNKISIEYDKQFETKDERDERHFIQRTLLDILMKECVTTLYDYNNSGAVKKVYQEVPAECFEAVLATLLESQRKMAEPLRKKSKETEESHKKKAEEQKAEERSKMSWYWRIFYR